MLNRSYYDDNFAYELMELYTALDTSVIEAMARRIARMGRVSDYTRWQAEILQEAGLLYEDIIRLIGEQTGMSDEHLQRIFEDAAVESVSFDNTIYQAAGLEVIPLRQSPSMMNLLRAGLQKTGGSLRNLTMTTANTAQTAYINACNLAYMQVSSGAMSYTEAIRAAVKTSAKQGTKVLYPSGHQDQLDVAIRRSVLTGVSQTSAVIGMENARLMGCDLMEITAHAGARPEHAAWQGKIVSLSGRKGYLSLADIGYGSVTGFKGANCRHDWYPFFEGISTRLYSDSQLEELAKSDLYDLQQGQRAMERQIRATRRELAGYDAAMSAADPDTSAAIRKDFDAAAVKLKKQEAALREYCRRNGLLEDGSRVQTLYGDGTTQGFGRSTSQKAVWANRKNSSPAESRPFANSLRRSPNHIITSQERREIIDDILAIEAPPEIFSFNTGTQTGFNELSRVIHVRGDIFPDLTGITARDTMSIRAVLAHEYYGHYAFHPSSYPVGDWRDEMRASYIAALRAPNLTQEERAALLVDAYDRAREAGYNYEYSKRAKEIIYGYQ